MNYRYPIVLSQQIAAASFEKFVSHVVHHIEVDNAFKFTFYGRFEVESI